MACFFRTEPFIYEEDIWQVMSFKEGRNKKIMVKIFDQLFQMLRRYSKVFAIRFDLRFCLETYNNKMISKFRDRLNRRLSKKYKCDIGYVWVREQTESAETSHYHYVLFLNGHKTWKSFGFGKIIDSVCDSLNHFSSYYPKNNGYMIKRDDSKSIQRVIYRLSYLAKNESKGNRPRGVSDYGTSRLKSIESQ
tara:strand:+ start:3348 stop:3923 length:576 start_codon:yes stop_codon:yes gene_type:complete